MKKFTPSKTFLYTEQSEAWKNNCDVINETLTSGHADAAQVLALIEISRQLDLANQKRES